MTNLRLRQRQIHNLKPGKSVREFRDSELDNERQLTTQSSYRRCLLKFT